MRAVFQSKAWDVAVWLWTRLRLWLRLRLRLRRSVDSPGAAIAERILALCISAVRQRGRRGPPMDE